MLRLAYIKFSATTAATFQATVVKTRWTWYSVYMIKQTSSKHRANMKHA